MEIVLARHGETEWSRDLKHTGRTDLPLTEHGRAAGARLLRARSPSGAFVRVLSSPLRARARHLPAGRARRRASRLTEDLLEWDYGEYEGITTAEIREARPDWYLWRDGCPGGESAADVGARVDRVIARAAMRSTATRCSSPTATCCACSPRAGWASAPSRARCFKLDTGTLSALGYERETPVISAVELAGAFRLGATAPIRATSGTNSPTMPAILRPRRKQTTASATPISWIGMATHSLPRCPVSTSTAS